MTAMHRQFRQYLNDSGLKATRQREAIVQAFFAARGHLSAEDLHRRVSRQHPEIGLVTVYRTLKILAEAGLAKERQFGGNEARYEPVERGSHHDHLICVDCGKIVEFENADIEALQDLVARRHGFSVTDHKLELYGHCRGCRQGRR